MEQEERERLEKELRLLNESLEADIISRAEYEQQKKRIESQLEEDGVLVVREDYEDGQKPVPKKAEKKKSPKKSKKKEPSGEKEIAPEEKEESYEKPEKEDMTKSVGDESIIKTEDIFKSSSKKAPEEIEEPSVEEEHKQEEEAAEEAVEEAPEKPKKNVKKSRKVWLKSIIALILAVIVIAFFYQLMLMEDGKSSPSAYIECISDGNCTKAGYIGACTNAGTPEAQCEFTEMAPVNLTVINDPSCDVCGSSRMESVLLQLFPGIMVNYLSFGTDSAKQKIEALGIGALPAYILGNEVEQAHGFSEFSRALALKGDVYLVSPSASGSPYFFSRKAEKGKLDLYLAEEHPVEKNLEEVRKLMGNKMSYQRHLVRDDEKEALKDEMAITTYPTFVVNNRFKFSGLQSAESIKEKFCAFNPLDECATVLSVS